MSQWSVHVSHWTRGNEFGELVDAEFRNDSWKWGTDILNPLLPANHDMQWVVSLA